MNPIDQVLAKLKGVKRYGAGWMALCPAHDDHDPSLSIDRGDDGRALLYCHAGCKQPAILAALGLMSDKPKPSHQDDSKRSTSLSRIVATYPYCDTDGTLLFEVVRYQPKDFRQRRPDGQGGWVWRLNDIRRVLYRLPELLHTQADTFTFVPEGEKDVDNLRAAGVIATTTSGGAGKGTKTDLTPLHGRHVVLLPDKDQTGRDHMQQMAQALYGKAASVRILELPGHGKDASDWLAAGGEAEHLVQMAESSPLYMPKVTSPPDLITPDMGQVKVPITSTPLIRELVTTCAADVKREPIRWLWSGRIPLGKLTLLSGDPKLGKSLLTLDIAARVSTGHAWPDQPGNRFEPGGVLIISAEDDLADTVCPRLDAAGADSKRITLSAMLRTTDPENGSIIERVFTLSDIPELERAIDKIPGCKLVVIDPVSAFIGEADSHVNAEIRGVLAPLAKLAADKGVAIVAVQHLNKASGGPAIYRSMGSIAFVAAARSVLAVCKDKDDPSGQRRLFLTVGGNLAVDAPGLAYTVGSTAGGVPYLSWSADAIVLTADVALGPAESKPGPESEELERAVRWLEQVLGHDPRPAREITDEWINGEGGSKKTLERARKKLGTQSYRETVPGPWWWKLQESHPAGGLPISTEPGDLGDLAKNEANTTETVSKDSKNAKLTEHGVLVPADSDESIY